MTDERVEINIFDEEEIHRNCTVQIWRNSVTGDVSIGWWENTEREDKSGEAEEDIQG